MTDKALEISSPIGLIAAGGVMPFAVADSLTARGINPVLFALKGACDPVRVERFRHHWISIGQLGKATKLFRAENCRDLVFIGTLVRDEGGRWRLAGAARTCASLSRPEGPDPSRARPRSSLPGLRSSPAIRSSSNRGP